MLETQSDVKSSLEPKKHPYYPSHCFFKCFVVVFYFFGRGWGGEREVFDDPKTTSVATSSQLNTKKLPFFILDQLTRTESEQIEDVAFLLLLEIYEHIEHSDSPASHVG